MKKLTLFCLSSEKDSTLEEMRQLGVLHISSINPPAGKSLDEAREQLQRVEKILNALPVLPGEKKSNVSPESIVEKAILLIQREKALNDELEKLKREKRKFEPFGDFDPESIRELIKKSISIQLFVASQKSDLIAPEGFVIHIIRQEKHAVYFALVGTGKSPDAIPESWQKAILPEMSLGMMRATIFRLEQELIKINNTLQSLAQYRQNIEKLFLKRQEYVDFMEARNGMGIAEMISYLQGFCPKTHIEQVQRKSSDNGWGLLIEDPSPDDVVPTLIHHSKWVKPLKALLDVLNILPGYREIDISAVFLVFFSIFFALLVGDAGYGLLFLLTTWLARLKWKRAPAYPFTLLTILSICTILWGSLTGNYFGISSIPAPLKALRIDWLNNNNHLMELCFLIGAIHLSIAHLWNTIKIINTLQAIAQIGWILITWTMFLAARYFVTNELFPTFGWYMFSAGTICIVLFTTPLRRIKHEFVRLAMLPLNLVSNFVDVISFLRLFAVGMATLAVAQNFNNMALSVGFSRLWTAPVAALILLVGHSLNILLCALAILVHGVRLNTLEFSSHIGLQWAGIKYDPFRAKS